MSKYEDAIKIMNERFNKDSPISIATTDGNRPSVRTVDGYYEEGRLILCSYIHAFK